MVSSVKTSVSSLKASQQGLDIVEQARIRKGWKRQSLAWADKALTSVPTLKRFLKGEPIQEDTFVRICRAVGVDWQKVVDDIVYPCLSPPTVTRDWGEAPDIWAFYGRNEELSTLEQWIVEDNCRVVALLGMGGIGKTALAVRCAEKIQGEFEYFIWRSLRNAPPLESLLTNLISSCYQQQETQANLSQLIDFLCQHRCLVILDEFDAILGDGHPVGHYRSGYEGYGELLKRVGQQRDLQSCLVLTSREKPQEIEALEGNKLPLRSLLMGGLEKAANEILREEDLIYEPEEGQELIQMYRGNPLALKIVSTTIKDLFDGSIAEFSRHDTIVICDRFREILDQHFQRLSELETNLMYALSIHQQPISLLQLQVHLQEKFLLTLSTSEIIETLDSLGRRCLIEKSTERSQVFFTLQPVVMKYVRRISGNLR